MINSAESLAPQGLQRHRAVITDTAPRFREWLDPSKLGVLPQWVVATITQLRKLKKKEVTNDTDAITRRIYLDTINPSHYRTGAYLNMTDAVCRLLTNHPDYQPTQSGIIDPTGLSYFFRLEARGLRAVVTGIDLVRQG